MRFPRGLPRRPLALALALAAGASAWASEPARSGPAQATASPPVEQELLRHMAVSEPGPEHRALDPLVGSWTVDLLWLVPGGKEARAHGTSENRFILGGRFLLCEAAVGESPSRIEATTVYGFDNRQRSYFAIGFNSLATHALQSTGSFDHLNRSFLLSGKERDEATGWVLVYRQLLTIEGPDRYVLRVYRDVRGGAPERTVEAIFTRR